MYRNYRNSSDIDVCDFLQLLIRPPKQTNQYTRQQAIQANQAMPIVRDITFVRNESCISRGFRLDLVWLTD